MTAWRDDMQNAPKDRAILLGMFWGKQFVRYVGHWNAKFNVWQSGESDSDLLFSGRMQSWFSHWAELPAPSPEPPQ